MSVQTSYGYNTVKGGAGDIVDLAPYAVDSFINENATGVMKPGMGVMDGTVAGKFVKVPTATDGVFEGILTNRNTIERDMDGNLVFRTKCAAGVMKYGRIFGALVAGDAPAYGDAVYLVCTGDDAGLFTKTSGSTTKAINARFMGTNQNDIAEIELISTDIV